MTGQQIIERMAAWIRQWVVISDAQAIALALWAVHTWMYERFSATPYLEISASTKRSGKTTLMEVLSVITRNAKMFATIRMLAVARAIDAYEGQITLYFDEAERLSSAALGDTRSMLATGYRRGQTHLISVGSKMREFPVYAPKAFALIGNVTDVLRDRSIPIYLDRATPPRSWTAEREQGETEGSDIVKDLMLYFRELERLPVLSPDWLRNREQEIWTPLWSIAHVMQLHKGTLETVQAFSVDAGALKQLPPRVFHSAQEEQTAEDRDMAQRLVFDIQASLEPGERSVWSATLIDRLRAIPTAPWRSYRGDGLNEHTMAALLERYGIRPTVKRIGKRTGRGYDVAALRKLENA